MRLSSLAMAVAMGLMTAMPAFAQTEYTIPTLVDNSGPFADLSKRLISRNKVLQWWSDTKGKELGVVLKPKDYDTRYDPSVVASLWPGILSEDEPVLALGLGGSDVAALQQRLPSDKVPILYAPPGYGYAWLPDQWIFTIRPTYVHEWAAALRWFIDQNPDKRPVKVAFLSSQASPAYVDIVNGLTKYINDVLKPKGLAEVAVTEWVEPQPVDLASPMKKIVDAKADVIIGTANTTLAGAAIRAEQLHGVSIPTIAATWHTIWPVSQAMKSYAPWEGHMVATGIAPTSEKSGKAWEFYQTLAKDYGLPEDWDPLTLLGISQGLVAVRAIEHTAERVGADKITGEAVFETLRTHTFTEDELMGILADLKFTADAPFPLTGSVKIETVKDGEYVLATPEWIPVPTDITKW
ncbi:ABC transporter substrate-binding protein [Rhodoligotrophos defluvii]|uniref:ABC transporter substrate-binding protein n=1 Tax=Rhodoligotrophos defluvii TaxID=2561934 RepID=UPI0010C9F5EF|nr:ABC transporter substrate-binding protein [Rhodoligotrophos defluvii]